MTILIAISTDDFDPTEVAIPWKILHEAGQDICFATDSGTAGICDQRMLNGNGFGILKPLLIAQKTAQLAYQDMRNAPSLQLRFVKSVILDKV